MCVCVWRGTHWLLLALLFFPFLHACNSTFSFLTSASFVTWSLHATSTFFLHELFDRTKTKLFLFPIL